MSLLVTVYILILFFYYSTSSLQFLGVEVILFSYKEGINRGYQWRVLVFIKKERWRVSVFIKRERGWLI